MKTKFSILIFFTLLFQIIVIQFSTHHIETLDWDINSFLVMSQEFSRGNLPYEFQYENKPPILFLIFYFFGIITGNSVLYIKVINDLIIFFLSILLLFIAKLDEEFSFWNYMPSFIFVSFISNIWFHPNYSEYISLLFIVFSYIFIKKNNLKYNLYISGFLISISTLINLGTIIFVLGISLIYFLNSKNKIKSFFNFCSGFLTPYFFVLLIYIAKGLLSEYIMATIIIPSSYAQSDFSFSQSLAIYLNALENYNIYIYFLTLISISLTIFIFMNIVKGGQFKSNKSFDLLILIICSVLFYVFAGKGYYHHLIYLLYFLALTFKWANTVISKNAIIGILLISLFTVNINFANNSIGNLKNFKTLEQNYPLKTLSEEILNNDLNINSVLSTNHILILYYLNKQNFSYIVHPALFSYPEITSILIEYNKIKPNEIDFLIDMKPSMIEGDFDFQYLKKEYESKNTSNLNLFFLEYWNPDKSLNIFIKK